MRKRLIILACAMVVIIIILIVLFSSGAFQVFAQGTIVVTLKDEETGKIIGKVDGGYVRVVLGGTDQGYLTDYGELKIEGVNPGTQELVLVVPYYGEIRRFVEVSAGQTVPVNIEVNMPNPVFTVGVDVSLTGSSWWQNLFGDSETGNIKVSLTNTGDADSVSTSVLVIVYRQDNLKTPIATKMVDFPSLVPRSRGGESVTKEWDCDAFVYGPGEVVAAVVFDGWPFTPQNKQVVTEVSVPTSMSAELSSSIANYLSQNPDIVINTITKIIIGWIG